MRQIYEGNQQTRLGMAKAISGLKQETDDLKREEERWLPIKAATGLPAEENTERDAFIAWLGDYLSEALPARLTPRQLEVLLMHGIDELTYEEIGRRMNISGSRVGQIMEQVRIQLEASSFRSHVFYP